MDVSRKAIWSVVLLAAAVVAYLYAAAHLGVDVTGAAGRLVPMALVAATLAKPRLRSERERRMADMAECWGLMAVISTLGALATYPVMVGTIGWHDAALDSWDKAMGFDWVGSYRFIAERPWLAWLTERIYFSIFVSPLIVIAGLTLTGRSGHARAFLLTFVVALVITILIFRFLPARDPVVYLLGDSVDYMPATGILHVATIEQLRSGELTMISIRTLGGLIAFPSFHASAAVLFIWAAWPVTRLRLPCFLLNLAMLIVIPVQGAHYLIEVIAGIGVAAAAIGAVRLSQAAYRGRFGRIAWPLQAATRTRSKPASEFGPA